MANPSPQHTPTDGLGTATQITVSGTGVTAIVPNRQYQVSLNVSASPNPSSVVLTAALKDAGGNAFASGNGNSASLKTDNAAIASVAGLTVTAVAKGQAVIDVRFPTYDNVEPNASGPAGANAEFIYAQILVNVGA